MIFGWLFFPRLLLFVIQGWQARTEIAGGNIIDNFDSISYFRCSFLPP
jgi:hypothetical protein